jgi:hypothetical protein
VLGGSFYRPEKGGERCPDMGAELGFLVLVSWPQWLRLGVGFLCGTVVMSGAQWRSRVTRGAVESSGQRWGSGRRALVLRRARGLWRRAGVRGCALWSGHTRAGVLEQAETEGREG